MEPVSLQWAAEILEARTTGAPTGTVSGICTDTRQGAQDALFFALQGENSDGHQYVRQAFEKGAVGAVVSREVPGVTGVQLVVPDTLVALGELAKHYRRQFNIPVVAVTGSVGKTSTKEMIAQVLRAKYRTLANEKNFNNEIGVPLTLFQLTREHQAAVVEMGMRGQGQIDRLAEIAEPTIGVITNIGWAHIELLGERDKIADAKAELLTRLPVGGVAILPYHDMFSVYLHSRVPEGVKTLTYGTCNKRGYPPLDVAIYLLRQDSATQCEAKVVIQGKKTHVTLKAIGVHHLHNAVAAFAVAHALDVPRTKAAKALAAWEGADGRMTLSQTADGLTVLDDCYNAGPESMEAALRTLEQIAVSGRVAVLGDMRELGEFAPELHRQVGRLVVETDVDLLITVGELAALIAEEADRYGEEEGGKPGIDSYADASEAAAHIHLHIKEGDTILVKGSRAMQMESIVTALTGQESPNRHA